MRYEVKIRYCINLVHHLTGWFKLVHFYCQFWNSKLQKHWFATN